MIVHCVAGVKKRPWGDHPAFLHPGARGTARSYAGRVRVLLAHSTAPGAGPGVAVVGTAEALP